MLRPTLKQTSPWLPRLLSQRSQPLLAAHCRRQVWNRRPRLDQHTPILFGEVNERGGYRAPFRQSLTFKDRLRLIRQAWLEMPESAAQLRDFLLYNRVPFKSIDVKHGDYYYIGNFSRDGGHNKWIVTCDSHYGEGYSTGEFLPTNNTTTGSCDDNEPNRCTGTFRGILDTRVPQIGLLARAGYVNLRSPYAQIIMGRARGINLKPLNCIVIRYRGDGRTYKVNMHRSPLGKLDIALFDMYSFPLYTRGGPYWAVCKIPVSRLMRVYKGRVQDQPLLDDLSSYQHFSITIADGIPGPFELELDYVAAFYDAQLNETFAYEIYPVSSLMKKNLTY